MSETWPRAERDCLGPEPSGPVNTLVGYGWVSTNTRLLGHQVELLEAAGCSRVFTDVSPARQPRPDLQNFLEYLRPNDVAVVCELSRLAKTPPEVVHMVVDLRERGVGLRSLKESLDTSKPGGELLFHVFASLAGCMRELSSESTREGLRGARSRGQRLGRPPALGEEEISQIRLLLAQPGASVASTARQFGVSRTTIYKQIPELGRNAGGRNSLLGEEDRA